MIVTYQHFDKLWKPPYGLPSWDYGLTVKGIKKPYDPNNKIWDYESHGREKNFVKWIQSLKKGKDTYDGIKILNSGICGGDSRMILNEDCTVHALSHFTKCAKHKMC